MKIITRKSDITAPLNNTLNIYHSDGLLAFVNELDSGILQYKVKFPLLEYCGRQITSQLPSSALISLCDKIHELGHMAGHVVVGTILQEYLSTDTQTSILKATEYISQATSWHICDIIGERVYGYALLNNPDMVLPLLRQLSKHSSQWVVRATGAGYHYAIKKGLDRTSVKEVFQILLTNALSKNKEIRQGTGWAAKTTAKFHPFIIDQYEEVLNNPEKVSNWFRRKVKIGLDRHQYAKKNRG